VAHERKSTLLWSGSVPTTVTFYSFRVFGSVVALQIRDDGCAEGSAIGAAMCRSSCSRLSTCTGSGGCIVISVVLVTDTAEPSAQAIIGVSEAATTLRDAEGIKGNRRRDRTRPK